MSLTFTAPGLKCFFIVIIIVLLKYLKTFSASDITQIDNRECGYLFQVSVNCLKSCCALCLL